MKALGFIFMLLIASSFAQWQWRPGRKARRYQPYPPQMAQPGSKNYKKSLNIQIIKTANPQPGRFTSDEQEAVGAVEPQSNQFASAKKQVKAMVAAEPESEFAALMKARIMAKLVGEARRTAACGGDCEGIYAPVCAGDGQRILTFASSCDFLKAKSCCARKFKGWNVYAEGMCLKETNSGYVRALAPTNGPMC